MVSVATPRSGAWAQARADAEVNANAQSTRHAPRLSLRTTGVISGSAAALLTADAMINDQTRFDVWTINTVQKLDFPYLHEAVTAVSALTSSTGAIAMWALTFIIFTAVRWWLPALATLTLPVGGLLNQFIGEVMVDRTRPGPEVVTRTVPDIEAASFTSGHVMGAVMLYGFLFFIAGRIENRAIRFAVRGFSALIISTIGFVRVWEGAHWATDVLGAYAFGGLFLAVLFAAYNRIEALAGHLPFVHSGEVEHDENARHAHALTSVVIFNGDSVTKVYNPGFLPRAIYWISFQAPFPYERNRTAVEAARERRNLAAMLTEYWHGESRVARITSIDRAGDRLAVTSELVDGHEPVNRAEANAFLRDLRARFEQVGFPTWQIDPRQPRAVDNVLETPDGRYMIVDLESGLVSPLASVRSWLRAVKRGHAPIFDTVYFDITRDYLAREADAMRATMGEAWVQELNDLLDRAESSANAWYASEPRLWSKLIDVRSWKPRTQASMAKGQEKAMGWLEASVQTWEAEGRISDHEAIALRAEMESPQFQAVIPHLGTHVIMSVLLRFPLGSIARASWTAWALLSATGRLMTCRIDRHGWRQAWSIHNPLVIALAAIPGFGAFAYLAAGPVRSNRLLMRLTVDAVMHKLPWRLYERTGMRRMMVIGRAAGSRQTVTEPETGRHDILVDERAELLATTTAATPEVEHAPALYPVPLAPGGYSPSGAGVWG